jgi:hypothetical protein
VPEGVVQVSDVEETKATDVQAAPPMVTVAPDTNPVPVIVTDVPPAAEPDDGVIAVTLPEPADLAAKKIVARLVAGDAVVTTPRFQAIPTPASSSGSALRVFG